MITEQLSYTLVIVAAIVMIGVVVVLAPASATITLPFGVLIVTGILQLLGQARAAAKVAEVAETAKIAATKVEEVAITAKVAAEAVAEVARKQDANNTQVSSLVGTVEATHLLVNSAYGASLRTALIALRQVAALTVDPAAKAAAQAAVDEAQKLYDEHMAKQAKVDDHNRLSSSTHRRAGDVVAAPMPTTVADIHIKADSVSVEGTGITVHDDDVEHKA